MVVAALAPSAGTGVPLTAGAPHTVPDAGTGEAGDAVRVLTAENAELRATNAELRKLVADLEGNMARSTKEIQKRRRSSGEAFWFVLFGVWRGSSSAG